MGGRGEGGTAAPEADTAESRMAAGEEGAEGAQPAKEHGVAEGKKKLLN